MYLPPLGKRVRRERERTLNSPGSLERYSERIETPRSSVPQQRKHQSGLPGIEEYHHSPLHNTRSSLRTGPKRGSTNTYCPYDPIRMRSALLRRLGRV